MYANTPVRSIMTRKPEVVTPQQNMEAVRVIFEKHGFHHIPVVEGRTLVGLVSYTDYLRTVRDLFGNSSEARANEKILNAMLVRDVMTRNVLCLNETDDVETALRIFKTNHFHSLPVINNNQELVGIITTYDVLKVLESVFALQSEKVTHTEE